MSPRVSGENTLISNVSVHHSYKIQAALKLFNHRDFIGSKILFEEILVDDASSWRALASLACIALEMRRFDEAISFVARGVRFNPELEVFYDVKIAALRGLGEMQAAREIALEAIERFPNNVGFHTALVDISRRLGHLGEVVRVLNRLVCLLPDKAEPRVDFVFAKRQIFDWREFESDRRALLQLLDDGYALPALTAMMLGASPEQQLYAARNKARGLEAAMEGGQSPSRVRRSEGPLRLGYISGDLHDHPTARLIVEMIEAHDREKVSVTAFSYGPDDGSEIRRRLFDAFDEVVEVGHLSDAQSAALIAAKEIDILVDLKGYTLAARPGILAHRPAFIQVNYLGFPGTMGANFVDYLIADRNTCPPGEEIFAAEKVVRLPNCFQPNDSRAPSIKAHVNRAAVDLPEDAFVFGAFHSPYKVSPEWFDIWTQILDRVPDSVLWILAPGPEARANLAREIKARGVARRRVVMAPRLPAELHLSRLKCVDLSLDVLPVGAFTTVSDSLRAGVPMLTLTGRCAAGRGATSVLRSLGFDELVTSSPQEYIDAAVRLATGRLELSTLKARIEGAVAKSPVFSGHAIARDLEACYMRMHARALSGLEPESFDLSPSP